MENETTPCPSCKESKILRLIKWFDTENDTKRKFYYLQCSNCGVQGPLKKDLPSAKKAWNTEWLQSRNKTK